LCHPCLMRAGNNCSWRRSGRRGQRRRWARSLVDAATVAAAVVAVEAVAMALGEVEDVAMRDLIHGKSGKKGAVLMGHPRSAASWEEDSALMLIERGEIHFESNP
jgi:hypothetical protein